MINQLKVAERKSFFLMIFEAYKSFSLSYIKQRNNCARERDLLLLAFTGTIILFLANIPVQIAELGIKAEIEKSTYIPMLGFISIFFMPLFLYFISSLLFMILKIFNGNASFYDLRLALFWSLNVAAPLLIINGLLNGFFINFGGIKYISAFLQCGVTWIICTMVSEAEQFKSKFPMFFVAITIIALPFLSSYVS